MRLLWIVVLWALFAVPALASNYGCSGLADARDLPTLEGRAGVMYRIHADLRMYHPFSDQTVTQMAALSQALAAGGTTLIYVPVPTKSVTMPQYLPANATLYGFDLKVATEIHTRILQRLSDQDVLTVDARRAMLELPKDELAFFKTDFHWTAAGARATAAAIAKVIRAHPAYADLPKSQYETRTIGREVAFSGMRRILQKHCRQSLPRPETQTYETRRLAAPQSAAVDLFGTAQNAMPVALVGTSFSDSPINNFTGFLAEYFELEVVNFAITGGNQFGAMMSYLTSAEFQENRPRFLIWENPIYNNLAQFGDQPMRELIAAAGDRCRVAMPVTKLADPAEIIVDLSGVSTDPAQTLLIDSDQSPALEARFGFQSGAGTTRMKTIARSPRLRRTGRFYMPLTGLWPSGAQGVRVQLDAAFGPTPTAYLCSHLFGG